MGVKSLYSAFETWFGPSTIPQTHVVFTHLFWGHKPHRKHISSRDVWHHFGNPSLRFCSNVWLTGIPKVLARFAWQFARQNINTAHQDTVPVKRIPGLVRLSVVQEKGLLHVRGLGKKFHAAADVAGEQKEYMRRKISDQHNPSPCIPKGVYYSWVYYSWAADGIHHINTTLPYVYCRGLRL